MRVVLISDTHGRHRDVTVPEGGMLVHAGDWSMDSEDEVIADFTQWMAEQPHKHKIVIAGNHDRNVEFFPEKYVPQLQKHATYLDRSGIAIEGFTFWGSPWTPFFHSDYWRFHTHSVQERTDMWDKIPSDLDILITHGPPSRILDRTLEGDYAGDAQLLTAVDTKTPRFHVFGHIHEGYGIREFSKTTFINASVLNRTYRLVNSPVVIEL
jgi:Icc-related predicted phosphoesterase